MEKGEKVWHATGITAAILGIVLTVTGIVLTQVLPENNGARAAGVTLTVLAGVLAVIVMYYTCTALKRNYPLFGVYSLGEPEKRTDLKRRVLATDDPVPENLTALAAVSSVSSQGNTLHHVPSPTPGASAAADEAEGREETPTTETAPVEAPFYESISRNGPRAAPAEQREPSDGDSEETSDSDKENDGPLPAHYVGTDDERIEQRLPERPPSDGSSTVHEPVYDAADGGPEPEEAEPDDNDFFEPVNPLVFPPTDDGDDRSSVRRSGASFDEDVTAGTSTADTKVNEERNAEKVYMKEKLAHMRGLNLLRRKERNKDFNTYENATSERRRFLRRGQRRPPPPNDDPADESDANSDTGSQFDNVSEIGEVDVRNEIVSITPSDLSYPESELSRVPSNLIF